MEEFEYTGVGLHHYYTLEQIDWICQFRGMSHAEIWVAFSILGVQITSYDNRRVLSHGLFGNLYGLTRRVVISPKEKGHFDEIGQVYGLKRGIDHASAKVRSRVRERPQ